MSESLTLSIDGFDALIKSLDGIKDQFIALKSVPIWTDFI